LKLLDLEFANSISVSESTHLNDAELAFYDALETNEASVRELDDEILKKIAVELAENLRKNVSVDWSVRETVRAKL
jgi:type I restriction enzyme R subunit